MAKHQKTERTHEENQERAYIAASRRTDRSIEARVQSAQMASNIHKMRTGKALRVSEAIVLREEVYEEEEQEFPRSYRLLRPHMQTSSSVVNIRVDAYLTNRVAMSKMVSDSEKGWRENEVNRAFAETFPQTHQILSQRWPSSGLPGPVPARTDGLHKPHDPSCEPNSQPLMYEQELGTGPQRHTPTEASPPELGADGDNQSSPPLTRTSESGYHPGTPQSQEESISANAPSPNSFGHYTSDRSAFITGLPLDAKMLMVGIGPDGVFDTALYCQPWISSNASPNRSYETLKNVKMEKEQNTHADSAGSTYWESATQLSNPVDELSWETFINDAAWRSDQRSAPDNVPAFLP
ncbi:hypothetical protein B0T10DRAFT_565063 [Thelonectria olida]|uniref:Uncharacterized protein n=1 Tax=Thelonectria olida TaxID=1576542 RepID=A0A9P9AKQ8_9HYPO|nr:hypothetical protein B0T10DRAFT_565063 [Thelonectria olida]